MIDSRTPFKELEVRRHRNRHFTSVTLTDGESHPYNSSRIPVHDNTNTVEQQQQPSERLSCHRRGGVEQDQGESSGEGGRRQRFGVEGLGTRPGNRLSGVSLSSTGINVKRTSRFGSRGLQGTVTTKRQTSVERGGASTSRWVRYGRPVLSGAVPRHGPGRPLRNHC